MSNYTDPYASPAEVARMELADRMVAFLRSVGADAHSAAYDLGEHGPAVRA